MPRIGVLAVQGDFLEHHNVLRQLGVEVREVRLPGQIEGVDGLIIPGGESTTLIHLIDSFHLREALREKVLAGMPVWGTCAGMIVIAQRLADGRPEPLHLMDIEVSRNAFGRQVDSFEADLQIDEIDGPPFRGVFIRAPIVNRVGADVNVLSMLDDGRIVAVRQDHMLATAFHPELTDDHRVHELFLRIVERATQKPSNHDQVSPTP